MRRSVGAWLIVAACSGGSPPPPRSGPPAEARADAAVALAPAPASVDPRLEELATRWDAARLAATGAAPVAAASGPVLQLVGGDVYLDDAPLTTGLLPDASALLIWAERDVTIGALLPLVATLRADAEIYLATARADDPALGWIRARALEQDRCAAWLSVTGAVVADVVKALDGADEDGLATDSRLCGASWRARFDALRAGGGSLHVRTGAGCSALTFASETTLVREGQPRLTFELGGDDDTLELAGPVSGKPAKGTSYVRCKTSLEVSDEDADSLQVESNYLVGMGSGKRRARLFYSGPACLASDAPPNGQPDCVGSVLASTSTSNDAVVDRVAAIAAKRGSLYRADAQCRGFAFAASTSDDGGSRTEITVAYQSSAIWVMTTRIEGGSADVHEAVLRVVHTADDHVLVDGARWYLTRKACERAAGSP